MWSEIATWQEQLNQRPDLSAKTIALYTQDARRFATWLLLVTSSIVLFLTTALLAGNARGI
jgi:hypothetical protein